MSLFDINNCVNCGAPHYITSPNEPTHISFYCFKCRKERECSNFKNYGWCPDPKCQLEQSSITYKYPSSYRLGMNMICNRCDSNNTKSKETSHLDGEIETFTYKVVCLDCGHEQ